MKKRTGDPWMPAPAYGRGLAGLGVNLMVEDVARAIAFQRTVLGADAVYADPDFAVMRAQGSEWMLHADHAYDRHPMRRRAMENGARGSGMELRLHGCDPDAAEAAATAAGYEVLAGAADKPHGLREAYIVDPDGYVWVPDVPTRG
ncbi:VOC family protein [Stella sp.]|uniref:VOC family protein n=1 Tax=Stella sp. TaxID=2912054 RepID=UPI0035B4E4EA